MKKRTSASEQLRLPIGDAPESRERRNVICFSRAAANAANDRDEQLRKKITQEIVEHSKSLRW